VTDLTPLAGLKNLFILRLDNTQVTDVTPLAGLTSLRELQLTNTDIAQEQVRKLQTALPGCRIIWTRRVPTQGNAK
jgi:Leucine-rich repeat (LRR) protein